jgi:hypothetical protein
MMCVPFCDVFGAMKGVRNQSRSAKNTSLRG